MNLHEKILGGDEIKDRVDYCKLANTLFKNLLLKQNPGKAEHKVILYATTLYLFVLGEYNPEKLQEFFDYEPEDCPILAGCPMTAVTYARELYEDTYGENDTLYLPNLEAFESFQKKINQSKSDSLLKTALISSAMSLHKENPVRTHSHLLSILISKLNAANNFKPRKRARRENACPTPESF